MFQLKLKFTQRQVTIHLFGLIVQYDSLNATKTHVAAIIQHGKQTDMHLD